MNALVKVMSIVALLVMALVVGFFGTRLFQELLEKADTFGLWGRPMVVGLPLAIIGMAIVWWWGSLHPSVDQTESYVEEWCRRHSRGIETDHGRGWRECPVPDDSGIVSGPQPQSQSR